MSGKDLTGPKSFYERKVIFGKISSFRMKQKIISLGQMGVNTSGGQKELGWNQNI